MASGGGSRKRRFGTLAPHARRCAPLFLATKKGVTKSFGRHVKPSMLAFTRWPMKVWSATGSRFKTSSM
eukprot:5351663-Pyramimonas_sp.AAC.1